MYLQWSNVEVDMFIDIICIKCDGLKINLCSERINGHFFFNRFPYTSHTARVIKQKWQTTLSVNFFYHFFRATLTKIHRIKINHIWTQIIYSSPHEAHLRNKRVAFVKKGKMWWNCKRSFFKNHRNCLLRTSPKSRLFRTFNCYSFNIKGGLCNRRTGCCPNQALCPGRRAVSVIFLNRPLAISPHFFFFLIEVILYFLDVLIKEIVQ